MTVAELIEKLKEMPQDLPVWRADTRWYAMSADEVEIGWFDDDNVPSGTPRDRRARIQAVIIS